MRACGDQIDRLTLTSYLTTKSGIRNHEEHILTALDYSDAKSILRRLHLLHSPCFLRLFPFGFCSPPYADLFGYALNGLSTNALPGLDP